MEVEKKLNELGYELPDPPVPAANYIGFVRAGNSRKRMRQPARVNQYAMRLW